MPSRNKQLFSTIGHTFALILVWIAELGNSHHVRAQTLLPYQEYLLRVAQNHPNAQRANLLSDIAQQQLIAAKGSFDPKLQSEWQGKKYNDKIYYSIFDAELKVPLLLGGDLKMSYQLADGYYLNSENTVPLAGLATVGIALPLLQGLKTDERRTNLQQAKLLQNINRNEQVLQLNDLLFAAALAYWDWLEAYQHTQIAQTALQLAKKRLNDLKNSVLQGDRPGIDTIEARLTVQERQLQLAEKMMDYEVSQIYLTNFLMPTTTTKTNESNSAALSITFIPLQTDTTIMAVQTATSLLASDTHPVIAAYQYKLNSLDIERRLKSNKLLPKLNIQYNFLAKQFNYFNNEGYGLPLLNNSKWGIQAALPLFFRQERGNLALTKLKIQDTQWQKDLKSIELNNKITAQIAKINNLVAQIRLYEQSVRDYQTLLDAENVRFSMGESSVFLLNTRETKLIEAKQKMVSLQMKYYRTRAELAWAKGDVMKSVNH